MLYLMVFGKTQKSIQTFLFSFQQFCFLFFFSYLHSHNYLHSLKQSTVNL